MTDALKPLLENDLLNEETKELIKEAWENQLKEAREEIEVNLREEFVARYEHDKGSLIEAVERMVTDGLEAEVAEFVQDRRALTEQRVKLANEIREARIDTKKKLADQMEVLESFILQQLGKEIKEFESDRKGVREAKKTLAKQLRESRVAYKTELTSKVELLEGFVLNQLKKELGEFHSDKKALIEQRVKMIKQGKAKIEETRKEFIKRSAKLVEHTLEDVLRREMSQFKDDIEASRKKHFGMQMFEAFATEYKASFFNENREVRGLLKRVNEGDKKLSQAKKLFEKAHDIANNAHKRQVLAENRAERTVVMNELLRKLSGKQREVMAELLEGVKTKNLRESFKKYIPAVTNGSGNTVLSRRSNKGNTLTEGKRVITGNKENKLLEQARAEEEDAGTSAEILNMKRLAGIN